MSIDRNNVTGRSVVDANRKFYDAVAGDYEKIDGRRSSSLEKWLRSNIGDIRKKCPGGKLLDLGAGSGLVTRLAEGVFDTRIALDVSHAIISANRAYFNRGVAADINRLPFRDKSFDAVTCFSVLHHLYDFEHLVPEVARVLRPGGIFYSDHDMDKKFSQKFYFPLSIYRKASDRKTKYHKACNVITPELYSLSEWQEEGIDSEKITTLFEKAGFKVEFSFHWFGLSAWSDTLFGDRRYPRGWAPLLSLKARKTI